MAGPQSQYKPNFKSPWKRKNEVRIRDRILCWRTAAKAPQMINGCAG
jgi:hypothetical protein